MLLKLWFSFLAISLFIINADCSFLQPEYQVIVLLKLHPKGQPMHLCNAAIIQNRLILTTASCVFYKFIPNMPYFALPSKMLSIVAGFGGSEFGAEPVVINVGKIIIHPNFNIETLSNDLAILHLETPLPLDSRQDIKWIIIDGLDALPQADEACRASFTAFNNDPQSMPFEEIYILDNQQCQQNSTHWDNTDEDICSKYTLPYDFACADLENFSIYNSDRGTGIVCRDRLIGLLSALVHPKEFNSIANCSEKPINAIYTNINPHINWIYDVMLIEEQNALLEQTYIASMPYENASSILNKVETTTTGITILTTITNEMKEIMGTTTIVQEKSGVNTNVMPRLNMLHIIALFCYFILF